MSAEKLIVRDRRGQRRTAPPPETCWRADPLELGATQLTINLPAHGRAASTAGSRALVAAAATLATLAAAALTAGPQAAVIATATTLLVALVALRQAERRNKTITGDMFAVDDHSRLRAEVLVRTGDLQRHHAQLLCGGVAATLKRGSDRNLPHSRQAALVAMALQHDLRTLLAAARDGGNTTSLERSITDAAATLETWANQPAATAPTATADAPASRLRALLELDGTYLDGLAAAPNSLRRVGDEKPGA